jgi:hypothetical protein
VIPSCSDPFPSPLSPLGTGAASEGNGLHCAARTHTTPHPRGTVLGRVCHFERESGKLARGRKSMCGKNMRDGESARLPDCHSAGPSWRGATGNLLGGHPFPAQRPLSRGFLPKSEAPPEGHQDVNGHHRHSGACARVGGRPLRRRPRHPLSRTSSLRGGTRVHDPSNLLSLRKRAGSVSDGGMKGLSLTLPARHSDEMAGAKKEGPAFKRRPLLLSALLSASHDYRFGL